MTSPNSNSQQTQQTLQKGPPTDVPSILRQVKRPEKALVTAGMPYANGPLHIGHLAGSNLPADIYARWLGLLIGRENVLFVNGTDDHGSTSEVAALQAGVPIREFIDQIHDRQKETLKRYSIGIDTYTGTSRPECFPAHKELAQEFIRRLYKNGMLEKRTSQQWYDPKLNRFLPDRYVKGRCPNPNCDNEGAYSDECDRCGSQYEPSQLIHPRSAISDAVPVMRDTVHWWLDMWKVSEVLRQWIQGKENQWRKPVIAEVLGTVLPSIRFDSVHEPAYKDLKASLPKHKPRYAPGKKLVLQFETKDDLAKGRAVLEKNGIACVLVDSWAHRSITRDVAWGIPLPTDLDPEMEGKTLYVWPDSLIAPISFTKVALNEKGADPARYAEFWCNPNARVYQFLGQDNVFFYVLMQGAMWLGTQDDPLRLPRAGEFQMTEIFGCFHLMVNGEKMSKSRGNFFTGDQLLDEKGYSADQIRYFLATLSLPEKASNFDVAGLDERNKFLAGPMNAAFEKPISAVHSKFAGHVPEGVLLDKVASETLQIVRRYVKSMDRGDYSNLLGAIENYARLINSLFTQYKPHDDRHPEEGRRNALYSCFYVLKNIMIMLYPFVPETMDRLRESLRLPSSVFRIDELGTPISTGHEIGPKQQFFPRVAGAEPGADS
ncbi:MAG: methionine--tRNA ligase [Bdellovibrionales bacterium RIFOXYC1_FULL_54_43]|nr:MAG: methionine--tRNA ligase [Bdellovibrionales bacterium RIFOXYC1_FULL_54_43]OFZ82550.1 MAG: methionine--tRNA ligase [Bdellovibrionales bacterium RIFOXYD1_FULL_55_31]